MKDHVFDLCLNFILESEEESGSDSGDDLFDRSSSSNSKVASKAASKPVKKVSIESESSSEEESESGSDDEGEEERVKKPKGVSGLIDVENPNRSKKEHIKVPDLSKVNLNANPRKEK